MLEKLKWDIADNGSRVIDLSLHPAMARTFRYFPYLILLVLIFPGRLYAEAFRIPSQSASGLGQGDAFAAQADDPSAIHYNPAGITQLPGIQLSLGTNLVGGHHKFKNASGARTDGDLGGTISLPPPSNFYLTVNLGAVGLPRLRSVTVGFGVTSPFGIRTRWSKDTPFSSAVVEASLPLLDLKPTIGYKFNDLLSVGAGADIYTFASFVGQGHLEQKFTWPGGGGIPAGAPIEINGSGTVASFNVSLLYTPFRNIQGKPLLNVAVVYRHDASLPLDGQFLVNGALAADASSTLNLPKVVTGGVAFWPIRNQDREWKVEGDVDYVAWDSFQKLDVKLSNGATLPFPQDWNNAYMLHIGTEYKWLRLQNLPGWEIALRGGYGRSKTPVPDRTFNPAVPDSDNHVLSVGVGTLCKENAVFLSLLKCGNLGAGGITMKGIGMDIAYAVVLYESRTVAGNINPTVNGTYKSTVHVGALNLRMQF